MLATVVPPGVSRPVAPPPPHAQQHQGQAEPDFQTDQCALARLRSQQGAWEDVIKLLTPLKGQLNADDLTILVRALEQRDRANLESVVGDGVARFPEHLELRLAWIDAAITNKRYATALERVQTAPAKLRSRPQLRLRAAQCHFHMDRVLGEATVREIQAGRPGQFVGNTLVVERRDPTNRALCCPPESALYQLRLALDAGIDDPAAHVLHARIWQRLGRPGVALAILKGRPTLLLSTKDETVLDVYSELARETGAMSDYLHCEWLRARRYPQRRETILFDACLTIAAQYNERGEEQLYIQWLHRAARLRPGDADLLLRLADAEWAADQREQAATLYSRILGLAPDHPQQRRILDQLNTIETQPSPR